MLSSGTVHAITNHLLAAAETLTAARDGGCPPTLLLIHDHPIDGDNSTLRAMGAVEFPLPTDGTGGGHRGLADLLHEVAATITAVVDATAPHVPPTQILTDRTPGMRLLAWAVRYDDVDTTDDDPRLVRRVDAVDIDGRVYQLTRHPGERKPIVLIDETPDPDDLPATQPALAALVHASRPFSPAGATA